MGTIYFTLQFFGLFSLLFSVAVGRYMSIDFRAVGGRPPRYAPAPLHRGRRSALRRWVDGNVAAVSHLQHVPTPTAAAAWRTNELTNGGEQSGLMTLTFDLLTLKVVSESSVTWATSVPILVFLGLSVLDLSYDVRDRRQIVRRQTASSLNAPAY